MDSEHDPGGPQCPASFLVLTVTSKNQRELSGTKTGRVKLVCSKQSVTGSFHLPLPFWPLFFRKKINRRKKKGGRREARETLNEGRDREREEGKARQKVGGERERKRKKGELAEGREKWRERQKGGGAGI